MDCQELIKQLGYKDNPAFLQEERFAEYPGYSFFFSQAKKMEEGAFFHGVYSIVDNIGDGIESSAITPVVYVFEVESEHLASKIHKKVWCQNTVPYVIVATPKNIRLYPGFEYDKSESDIKRALAVAKDANEILDKFSALTSTAIDSGNIWKKQEITTEKRVDRHLLENLSKLSQVLQGSSYSLSIEDAHSLIGKYIYLKYLRDRDILSDMRLEQAGVTEEDIYSRIAQKEKLYDLEIYLNDFLNGSVFPLPIKSRIKTIHVQKVAGAFRGDDPKSEQQVLFDLFDFSYVPIETLSVVYQQFLHQKGEGRGKGAYYTPVHLVNFVIDELNAKKPLQEGMQVFDPSCGSGAFLVQCYRRLIESKVSKGIKLKPTELRKILVDHIFGLDADEEACRVAELSLSLTLLDYVDPPDLSKTKFLLPNLHNQNVFHCEGGFFDDESLWVKSIPKNGYHWIIGNPPWKNKYDIKKTCDEKALCWINSNKNKYPIGKQQLAEAFAWRTSALLAEDGLCGFLMPALTLFKKQGKNFRHKFFSDIEVSCIVNFSNLRHCLFEGAENPVIALFYSGKRDWRKSNHYITTYAPFAVEQFLQFNQRERSKKIWSVLVDYSAVKEIPLKEIKNGDSEAWKTAMWGTRRDLICQQSLKNRNFPTMEEIVKQVKLSLGEGLQLRSPAVTSDRNDSSRNEELELCNEVQGKKILIMHKLEGCGSIHSLPENSFEILPRNEDIYTRKGRKNKPLNVCYGPHVILDECRRFAVFTDDFVVIPPHQIGVSFGEKCNKENRIFLKALALYLKSTAAYYLQFWTAVKMGIERDVFNLADLKKIPVPLSTLSETDLLEWAKLHDDIVKAEKSERKDCNNIKTSFFDSKRETSKELDTLLVKMNNKVDKILGISNRQRWLIEDFVNFRVKLNDGKVAEEAIESASKKEIFTFAQIFQREIDLFLDHTGNRKVHKVCVYYTDESAVLVVDHMKRSMTTTPEVIEVCDNKTRKVFGDLQNKLTAQKSQWLYYTRCLRVYEERRTYIFKPRQRLYWLKSQALVEADEFIEEKVGAE